MSRRFKSKKKNNNKLYIYFTIIVFSFCFSLFIFDDKNEERIVNIFLTNVTNKLKDSITTSLIKINSPENIIYSSLNKNIEKNELTAFNEVEDDYNYEESNTDYVEDPNPKKVQKPIVYIYNTHQLEEYSSRVSNDYNVKPNVLIASYILKEKLNEKNIPTIVETANMKKYINKNGLKYKNSYRASRNFLLISKNKNKNLNYFIDIHRDSVKYDKTTLTYNKEKYAKVMFVVGIKHSNYKKNLKLAKELNNLFNVKLPGISRGISKKGGNNVNGVYNQDINKNVILIEIGGVENSIEEVNNTLEIFSEVLESYIKV